MVRDYGSIYKTPQPITDEQQALVIFAQKMSQFLDKNKDAPEIIAFQNNFTAFLDNENKTTDEKLAEISKENADVKKELESTNKMLADLLSQLGGPSK